MPVIDYISYMIYNEKYQVKFYRDSKNGNSPVENYIKSLDEKCRSKIYKYINYLKDNNGYLDEPYSRHINWKIRELRVDSAIVVIAFFILRLLREKLSFCMFI